MQTTFTTHFGSVAHGVTLQWGFDSTATVAEADRTLTCLMTGNLVADLLTA
jgi:hypothetical protein